MIQRRGLISGRVQGVGFRAAMLAEASQLREIQGWVKNLEDGRVEAIVAGPEQEVIQLVEWCRHGPSQARVEQIEVLDEVLGAALSPFKIALS